LSTLVPPYLLPGSEGRGGAREGKGGAWREGGRERSGD